MGEKRPGQRLETVSKVKDRISSVLNRPVITESDKKAFSEIKSVVLNDSATKTIHLAKARILSNAKRSVLRSYLGESSHRVEALVPLAIRSGYFAAIVGQSFSALRTRTRTVYAGFSGWMKKPVTVSTALALLAIWMLAIMFTSLQFPWSEVGYTSGYGAVLMTAMVTARLTVNSKRVWLEPPRRREAATEMNHWLIETAIARKSLVLHEIEEFLATNEGAMGREANLKRNAFLMRKRDWQSLQDALYDTFLKGAPPLLFELGHRLGASVGRDLVRFSGTPKASLTQLDEVSRTLGWGMVSVGGELVHGTMLTFTIRESPFCVAETPLVKSKYSCHMLRGMVSGIAEEVYGWPYSSLERECVHDGRDSCKIVVTQMTDPHVNRGRWNLSVLFPVLYPWNR